MHVSLIYLMAFTHCDLNFISTFFRYQIVVLCVGEAYYNDDALGYIPGSIRTWVCYSVANEHHTCFKNTSQRNNPISKEVENMKYCHNIEKNNLVIISNKKMLAEQ